MKHAGRHTAQPGPAVPTSSEQGAARPQAAAAAGAAARPHFPAGFCPAAAAGREGTRGSPAGSLLARMPRGRAALQAVRTQQEVGGATVHAPGRAERRRRAVASGWRLAVLRAGSRPGAQAARTDRGAAEATGPRSVAAGPGSSRRGRSPLVGPDLPAVPCEGATGQRQQGGVLPKVLPNRQPDFIFWSLLSRPTGENGKARDGFPSAGKTGRRGCRSSLQAPRGRLHFRARSWGTDSGLLARRDEAARRFCEGRSRALGCSVGCTPCS